MNICLISQFKNETLNLSIFIKHYLWQGVNKFYLIDNNSNDNPLFILQEYIDKGIVEYIFNPEKYKQVEIFRNTMNHYNIKNFYDWVIYCDLDEFYYGYPNILKTQLIDFNCHAIYTNWRLFGSDGVIEHPEDIRISITHRAKELSKSQKYIFNPKNIDTNNLHIHYITNNSNNFIVENNKIRLNHYAIQSLTYFKTVKMVRGDVNKEEYENIRDMNYFNAYDFNDYEDNDLKILITNMN